MIGFVVCCWFVECAVLMINLMFVCATGCACILLADSSRITLD